MAINTGKIQSANVIRELLKSLRGFSTSTLPSITTLIQGSLSAELAVRAYYQVKNFRAEVTSILSAMLKADVDAAYVRETGEVTGIYDDLAALNTSIQTFLTLIESNQSAIFETMTLGISGAQYGNLTTAQRNAIVSSLQSIAANFNNG